jgi:hypothetical protein
MDPLHVAEPEPRLPPRFCLAPPVRHQLTRALADMEVELLAYLPVERVWAG